MSVFDNNLPIRMWRANLEDAPEFALPGAFSLRWYQPGDEADWLRIHLAADHFNEIVPELFRRQFGVEPERGLQSASASDHLSARNTAIRDLRQRQCYLLAPAGEAIGTGTAWFDDDFEGARWGRVHWMAIVPEFQGRGLAKPLLTSICRRLRELGHQRVYLSTSSARPAAIGLYLRFGFAPLIRGEAEAAIWREVLPAVVRRS